VTAARQAFANPPAVGLTPFGLALGHATDADGATGCTVVRGIERPVRAAHALLGRASGSRELAAASPEHLVGRVDAVLLTGGSAYGLDAAAGVMRWMEERGRGFPVGGPTGSGVVPLVPAAVLFDLSPLGRFDRRPTPDMAYAACERASPHVTAQGSVGAGAGLTVGKALGAAGAMKGGVGVATVWEAGSGPPGVAAVAAVNAFGDVRDGAGRVLAGARRPDGTLAGDGDPTTTLPAPPMLPNAAPASPFANTTVCVVATAQPLGPVALAQLARAAAAALYRRITPCGTSFDGDVIFALCPDDPPPADASPADLLRLELLAVRALEEAVERAVRFAAGRDGVPGLADPMTPPR